MNEECPDFGIDQPDFPDTPVQGEAVAVCYFHFYSFPATGLVLQLQLARDLHRARIKKLSDKQTVNLRHEDDAPVSPADFL
jgi:hypothetical protein